MRKVEHVGGVGLEQHASVGYLAHTVRELQRDAAHAAPLLEGRTVWMVNSTEHGGGVAEMLPAMVCLLRDLDVRTEWAVLESSDPAFFALTKRIHNMIHGDGEPALSDADRALFDRVSRENADVLADWVRDGDVLVVHDPQPIALAALLRERRRLCTIWRCHIGLDEENDATRAAWEFLAPFAEAYDRAVFSAPEYIPRFLAGRSVIIHPAIDPLAPKNEHLGLHRTVHVLVNAGLAREPAPVYTPDWEHRAQRLHPDGRFGSAVEPDDIGVLARPIITQVSRWDRLKGFLPLMLGFAELKRTYRHARSDNGDPLHLRRLELVRLILAGPDPESVADDPEATEVLRELCEAYTALDEEVRRDIALITLPMHVPEQNALMVNALHRVSTIVAQNSLREGFGLTITEAMWKHVPVLTNSRACGPRHQVRDGRDGRVVRDPENVQELAAAMMEMLEVGNALERWGRSAQHHAHQRFLIFGQLTAWLELLLDLLDVEP